MNKFLIGLFTLLLVFGCGDNEEELPPPDVQMAEYIAATGLNVTTSSSGLSYEIHEEGEGEFPITNSILQITFIGRLTDGTIFAQSTTPVGAYISTQIAGLAEGLRLLKNGGRATLVIPPDIGFGSVDAGIVPGNSVTVYEIEIHDIDNEVQETIDQYIADNNLAVQETPEGLFYVLNEPGGSEKPDLNSFIEINYEGRFFDGGVFDESGTSSASFPLSNLIEGWKVGIPLMGRGGSGLFIIPPQLAYGFEGRQGIPGNEVLLFDIELIDF